MVYCVAINCSSDSTKVSASDGVHFHTFPTDPGRRREWIVKCRRGRLHSSSWVPGSKARLCSRHFTDDQYDKPPGLLKSIGLKFKPVLKPEAVPRVFEQLGLPNVIRTTGSWRKRRELEEVRTYTLALGLPTAFVQ
jgi:hypothetical protein